MNPLARLVRRLIYGAPIIVVSGVPRSGTSMLMGMLGEGGVELVTDELRAADEDNPKGYFELDRVKDLARIPEKRWLYQARGKGIKVVSTLLRELPSTHNYKVILVRRNLDEVLASQARMLVRRGETHSIDDAKMRRLLENDLWRAGYLLEHAGHFEHLVVDYAKVIGNPIGQARRIAEFFGGGLDVDAMADVVDVRLYRNRAKGA